MTGWLLEFMLVVLAPDPLGSSRFTEPISDIYDMRLKTMQN
jgi:hypothetical protein